MVVIDVDLPDGSGLDLIPELRAKIPGLKVLVLSEQVTPAIVSRREELKIDGFVDIPNMGFRGGHRN
jgi:DNA-binding NarL/FixJ family response regulator